MWFSEQRERLVWFDGAAGLSAGVLVLMASPWLAALYALPISALIFTGLMNCAYGAYSSTLARRPDLRTRRAILALVIANASWPLVCALLIVCLRGQISAFGVAHLVGEALFVGGLAVWEWRWRDALVGRTSMS